MGLCIPETRNLRFRSWSIPGRDNSPKGSGASKAHGALHNSPKGSGASKAHGRKRAPRSLREEIFLVKKKFLYWKKRVPLCEKDIHTLKKFLIESIWWKIVHNSQIFHRGYLVENRPPLFLLCRDASTNTLLSFPRHFSTLFLWFPKTTWKK